MHIAQACCLLWHSTHPHALRNKDLAVALYLSMQCKQGPYKRILIDRPMQEPCSFVEPHVQLQAQFLILLGAQ